MSAGGQKQAQTYDCIVAPCFDELTLFDSISLATTGRTESFAVTAVRPARALDGLFPRRFREQRFVLRQNWHCLLMLVLRTSPQLNAATSFSIQSAPSD